MQKNKHDDDDGRTVADMSGIDSPSLFGRLPKKKRSSDADATDDGSTDKPWEADKDTLARRAQGVYLHRPSLRYRNMGCIYSRIRAYHLYHDEVTML